MTETGRRPSVPFGQLLALPDLEAELRVPERLDDALAAAPVVSTPVIDLSDPRPHLTGAELLLTTGLGFTEDDEWYRSYVRGVREAGTVAIGFGIEPVYPAVPPGLERACRELGMPLVTFAPQIPFVHITTAFFAAIEHDRVERLDRLNRLALSLMRAALATDPATAVAGALARSLDALVVFERGSERLHDGRLDDESGHPVDVEALLAAIGRLGLGGGERQGDTDGASRASRLQRVSLPELGVQAIVTRLRTERAGLHVPARLVIASRQRLQTTDLSAAILAADTLQLARAGIVPGSASIDTLVLGLVVDALRRGDTALRERTMRLLRQALGAGRSAGLYACAAHPADGREVPDDARAWWRAELATPLTDRVDQTLRALVAKPPSDGVIAAMRADGWHVVVTGPHIESELPSGLADAVALAAAGRDTGPTRRWEGFAGAEVRGAAARRALAPMLRLSAADRREHETVLRAWLEHHGGWDATARTTGLHRNTVRRVIGSCSTLLDADLDDARVRAELLFALDELR